MTTPTDTFVPLKPAFSIEWVCDKGHVFAIQEWEHPHRCRECESPLVTPRFPVDPE